MRRMRNLHHDGPLVATAKREVHGKLWPPSCPAQARHHRRAGNLHAACKAPEKYEPSEEIRSRCRDDGRRWKSRKRDCPVTLAAAAAQTDEAAALAAH
jgi:hypothetical protein